MSKDKKIFLGFALLTLIMYGQSLMGGFVFDDRGIAEHTELWTGIDKVFQVASYPYWTADAGLYRPVTLLSYLFNSLVLGHAAFGFHVVNLLLYWGIGVLIYLLLKKLFDKELFAILAAALFLVLPIHTEVVANISGRSELLALFFSLLTLFEFTLEEPKAWRTFLWMLLAIGSKETAIATLPLSLLLMWIQEGNGEFVLSRLREVLRKYQYHILAVFGATGSYFFLRFLILGSEHFVGVETSIIENPLLFSSSAGRVATALSILTMYVRKTFIPLGLCSDYSYNQIPLAHFFSWGAAGGVFLLVLALVVFFAFLTKRPLLSFASAIFLTSFIPVSNLLFPIGTIAGERLFFFASLGFVILLAWFLSKRGALVYVALTLVVGYAAVSFTRQGVWVSEEKLFTDAAECAPQSVLSLSNLGTVYYLKGEYQEAEKALEASKAINPVYSKGLNNLGLVYWKEGRIEEARQMYYASLHQKYPYPGSLENLVSLYLTEGEWDKAEHWLRVINPNAGAQVHATIEAYKHQ